MLVCHPPVIGCPILEAERGGPVLTSPVVGRENMVFVATDTRLVAIAGVTMRAVRLSLRN